MVHLFRLKFLNIVIFFKGSKTGPSKDSFKSIVFLTPSLNVNSISNPFTYWASMTFSNIIIYCNGSIASRSGRNDSAANAASKVLKSRRENHIYLGEYCHLYKTPLALHFAVFNINLVFNFLCFHLWISSCVIYSNYYNSF